MTTEQIKEWMIEKGNALMTLTPNQSVQFVAKCHNFGGMIRVEFESYASQVGHTGESDNPDEAIESFRIKVEEFTPKEKAAKLRQQAAELTAKADKLSPLN